ncbi:Cna B-type domain-containing protein, partial [Aerococcaceae bacterium DSM 111176]|nr:Cna B-type domain-containing protein [Aerococcaceae bacterium DSM 111176]
NGNLTITNSYTPETTSIDGTKHWRDEDDQDGVRPDEVTIILLGNNVEVERQVVTEAENWNYSFNNLPVYSDGTPITYTVSEDLVTGYSSTTDGFDVYNDRTPDEVSISVFKSWLDNNNQDGKRPESVQVQLFGDGTEVGTPVTLT